MGGLRSQRAIAWEPLFATPYCNTSRATWSTPSEPSHKKPFFEVLSFSALFGPGCSVVNLFVLNLACFISVCPGIPETWYLALVLAGCCFVNFVCFEFVVLHFRLPIYPKRETGRLSNTYVQRRNKKDLAPPPRARGSTWDLFLQVY